MIKTFCCLTHGHSCKIVYKHAILIENIKYNVI